MRDKFELCCHCWHLCLITTFLTVYCIFTFRGIILVSIWNLSYSSLFSSQICSIWPKLTQSVYMFAYLYKNCFVFNLKYYLAIGLNNKKLDLNFFRSVKDKWKIISLLSLIFSFWYCYRFRINWVELSWIGCLTSQLTIFQSYMWRHIDVQADWRRSWTYGRAPNAIDIS